MFAAGSGEDIIGDFAEGDLIEFRGGPVSSFSALQPYMSEWNGTTYIEFDANNHIALENVAMSSLTADDFRFL